MNRSVDILFEPTWVFERGSLENRLSKPLSGFESQIIESLVGMVIEPYRFLWYNYSRIYN